MFIEVEEFSLREGTEVASFRALDSGLQSWSHLHRRHVLRRTTAIAEDRDVLVVTLFGGSVEPEPPDPSVAAVKALSAVVDPTSYRRRVYHDLGG